MKHHEHQPSPGNAEICATEGCGYTAWNPVHRVAHQDSVSHPLHDAIMAARPHDPQFANDPPRLAGNQDLELLRLKIEEAKESLIHAMNAISRVSYHPRDELARSMPEGDGPLGPAVALGMLTVHITMALAALGSPTKHLTDKIRARQEQEE